MRAGPLLFVLFATAFFTSCSSGRNLLSSVKVIDGTLIINKGETFILDKSIQAKHILINGSLLCDEDAGDLELQATSITVNGLFLCGTRDRPHKNKLIISLTHSEQHIDAIKHEHNHSYRILGVNAGGVLRLHGYPGKESWVRLNTTAAIGQDTLWFDKATFEQVKRWEIGDEIVIGPTSYRSTEAETFRIRSIDGVTGKVFLDGKLKHRHWGEIEEVTGPANGTRILDERAEVANLTRNILIQGVSPRDELGGHVMVMAGGRAYIDRVKFRQMGQAGIMGRYPFHWHKAGTVNGQYIMNSSIHRSFQRCVVIHETHEALVSNNVCSDFKGHGFFLETGNEVKNRLFTNLAINAKFPSAEKVLLASEALPSKRAGTYGTKGIRLLQFSPVASFWISHPYNEVVGNVASGSVGTGFWMAFAPKIREYSPVTRLYDGPELANPIEENTLAYSDNISHSCAVGQSWEGAPNLQDAEADMMNQNNPMDRMIRPFHYSPRTVPLFARNHAWKNVNTGLYFRGDTAVFEDSILADNGRSVFFVNNQILRKSTIVGRSRNHSSLDDEYLYSDTPVSLPRQAGVVLYDGPIEIEKVDFVNFPQAISRRIVGGRQRDVTSVPIEAVGSLFKYSNLAREVRFNPPPVYRVLVDAQLSNQMEYVDVTTSQHLIDSDGSLTGEKGAHILPEGLVNGRRECRSDSAFVGFRICPPTIPDSSLLSFRFQGQRFKVPFLVRSNGAILSIERNAASVLQKISSTPHEEGYFQNKIRLIDSDDSQISISSPVRQALELRLNAPQPETFSPIFSIEKLGPNCKLAGAQRVSDLGALRRSGASSFFSQGIRLFVRLRTNGALNTVKVSSLRTARGATETESPWYRVECP